MAFVDVRMPPGWDGIETSARLWQVDPDLQIVICTAYMDYSWEEMVAKLGYTDRLVILKKPFEAVEVLQLASALTEKWRLHQEAKGQLERLESLVRERTSVLEKTNAELTAGPRQHSDLERLDPHLRRMQEDPRRPRLLGARSRATSPSIPRRSSRTGFVRSARTSTTRASNIPNGRLREGSMVNPSAPGPPKATSKPPQSLLIANRLRPQSHPKATLKPPQSHPKATPERMQNAECRTAERSRAKPRESVGKAI